MTGRPSSTRSVSSTRSMAETGGEALRPLYARVLGLDAVNPGGVLCFFFFEGSVALAVLLALAELVSWWGVVLLPLSVAVMVKLNDLLAAAVIRSATRVPERERDRFRRELPPPVVGRATVPVVARVTDLRAVRSTPGRASGPPRSLPDRPVGRPVPGGQGGPVGAAQSRATDRRLWPPRWQQWDTFRLRGRQSTPRHLR